jgi:hypothetical protein
MNEEKKIAKALLDAMRMREDSYSEDEMEYTKYNEDCLIAACKLHGLSPNLWALLSLGIQWGNDIQRWCEDVLADKNVMDSVITQEQLDDIVGLGDERT